MKIVNTVLVEFENDRAGFLAALDKAIAQHQSPQTDLEILYAAGARGPGSFRNSALIVVRSRPQR